MAPGGPGRAITSGGLPARWDNTHPIFYDLNPSPPSEPRHAGAGAVDPRAERFVAKAFDQWAKIDTAQLTFQEGIPLDRDVSGGKSVDFLHKELTPDENPVIVDGDGGVTDALLGQGASRQVLAFGRILQATPNGKITQGMV